MLAILLLLNAGPPPHAPDLRGSALLVGVDRVDHYSELARLRYAGRDAATLGRYFQAEFGLDTTIMTQEKARDDPKFAPDSRRVKRKLRSMLALARPGDTVVFFFSGHGGQDRGVKDVTLVLADSSQSEADSLLTLTELYKLFEKCRATQKLIILDACRRTSAEDRVEEARPGKKKLPVLDIPPPPAGTAVLLSCAPDETSSEPAILGHGVFTYFLLKELRRAATAGDAVSASSLLLASAEPTRKLMLSHAGREQTPQLQAGPGVEVILNPPGAQPLRDGLRASERRRFLHAELAFTRGLIQKRTARLYAERSLARSNRGDRKGAMEDADASLKLAPDHPLGLQAKAEAHSAFGELKAGIDVCNRALRIDPNFVPALISRSSLLLEAGEYARGLDDAEQAARFEPNNPEALFQRASARDWCYQDGEAAEDARRFLKLRPGNPHALRMVARLTESQIGREEYEALNRKAIAALKGDLVADPSDLNARLNLASALKENRDYVEAEKLILEARKRSPDDSRVLASLAGLRADEDSHAEAAKLYSEAAKLAPELSLLYLGAARAHDRLRDKEKTLAALEAALKVSPSNPEVVWKRARVLEDDDPQKALEDCSRMVALLPNSWMAYHNRAKVAREAGNPALALSDLAVASKLAGNDPTPRCERGRVLRMLGRLDEALAEFALAQKLAPKSPLVYSYRGMTHTALKDHAAAVRDHETALALDPNDHYQHELLGRALYDAGRYEEASDVLGRGLAKGAKDPDVALWRGLARLQLGDTALDVFGKAEGKEAEEYARLLKKSATDKFVFSYDSLVRSKPDDFFSYLVRARTRMNRGDHAEAAANGEVILKMHPRSPLGHVILARALAAQKEIRRAIAQLDKAIRLAPRQPHLYKERAALHEKAGDKERAKADNDKAVALMEKPPPSSGGR